MGEEGVECAGEVAIFVLASNHASLGVVQLGSNDPSPPFPFRHSVTAVPSAGAASVFAFGVNR